MTIEIFDKIASKLRLRELGLTEAPIDIKEGSLVDFDIEDSFIKPEDDPDLMPTPRVNPDSVPE